MNTGDIILFETNNFLDSLFNWSKTKKIVHVCIILKDPAFLHPDLKGVYIMESNLQGINAESVTTIYPLAEILSKTPSYSIFWRSLNCDRKLLSDDKMLDIFCTIRKKPYDICSMEWIENSLQRGVQHREYVWGSALIGYVYSTCGIIDRTQDWTTLIPADFSEDCKMLNFVNDCKLEKQVHVNSTHNTFQTVD